MSAEPSITDQTHRTRIFRGVISKSLFLPGPQLSLAIRESRGKAGRYGAQGGKWKLEFNRCFTH